MLRERQSAGRRGILLLAILLATAILAGAGGLVALTWLAVDREVSTRETALVRRAIDRTAGAIRRETGSAAEWDDAYRAATRRDQAWMRRYFAAYYRNSFRHDLTLVLDQRGDLLFASRKGETLPADVARGLAAAARAPAQEVQLAEVRKRDRPDAIRRPEVTAMAETSAVLDLNGDLYLVGVATVLPSSELLHGATPAMTVLSGRQIDRAFLAELESDLGIKGARVARVAHPSDLGSAPLGGPPARTHIVWTPAQPGLAAVAQAARPILLVLFGVAAVCALLFWRLFLMLRRQATQDRALATSLEDLRAARDAAQAASVAKSRFIANISHEIRTPLNGVLGMAQAMQGDELNPAQRERVAVIRESGHALLAVLNDVLDLSKIEAGKLELEIAEFDLTPLAHAALAAFTAVAERKGLDFRLDVEPGAAGRYRSDATRLRQVLYNLISNALKFTEAGSVSVRVSREGKALVFEVADTGIGMTDAVRQRLFQTFEQADATTTRRFGGTGLGLAISRELVERLGGTIEVDSIPGAGSTFRVALDIARVGDEAEPTDAGETQAPLLLDEPRALRVLAAEDNAVNRLVLRTLLLQIGIEHHIVDNGAEALEAWRAAAWDVILMDVQMPVMDGPTATGHIRAEEARTGAPRTPIIALTANAMSHQVAEYIACGMDACVAKPIDIGQLVAALIAATEDDPAADDPAAEPTALAS